MGGNPNRVEYRGTGFYASVIASVIIAVAMLAFAVQNTDPVTVKWFGFEFTTPLFAWVAGAALLAVVIDELVGLIWRARKRGRLARARPWKSSRPAPQRRPTRRRLTSPQSTEGPRPADMVPDCRGPREDAVHYREEPCQ